MLAEHPLCENASLSRLFDLEGLIEGHPVLSPPEATLFLRGSSLAYDKSSVGWPVEHSARIFWLTRRRSCVEAQHRAATFGNSVNQQRLFTAEDCLINFRLEVPGLGMGALALRVKVGDAVSFLRPKQILLVGGRAVVHTGFRL